MVLKRLPQTSTTLHNFTDLSCCTSWRQKPFSSTSGSTTAISKCSLKTTFRPVRGSTASLSHSDFTGVLSSWELCLYAEVTLRLVLGRGVLTKLAFGASILQINRLIEIRNDSTRQRQFKTLAVISQQNISQPKTHITKRIVT